jgi:predicted nucleic acid-binding protein
MSSSTGSDEADPVIVVDSNFLIAFHNTNDIHHKTAAAVMRRFQQGHWGRGLLLEYVFLEVVTVLMARRGLAVATAVANILLQAEELDFVPCSDFFIETLEIFRNQARGALSFADAAIVAVARRRSGGLVATFDADFRSVDGITVVAG